MDIGWADATKGKGAMTIVLGAISLLLVVLGIPLMLRRVGPNPLYGLRLPATFADEWVWYEANALTGRDLLLHGMLLFAVAVVLPLFGIDEAVCALSWSVVAVIGVIVITVVGWRRANALLRQRRG
jgi:uncharacterized membrane protein